MNPMYTFRESKVTAINALSVAASRRNLWIVPLGLAKSRARRLDIARFNMTATTISSDSATSVVPTKGKGILLTSFSMTGHRELSCSQNVKARAMAVNIPPQSAHSIIRRGPSSRRLRYRKRALAWKKKYPTSTGRNIHSGTGIIPVYGEDTDP